MSKDVLRRKGWTVVVEASPACLLVTEKRI